MVTAILLVLADIRSDVPEDPILLCGNPESPPVTEEIRQVVLILSIANNASKPKRPVAPEGYREYPEGLRYWGAAGNIEAMVGL